MLTESSANVRLRSIPGQNTVAVVRPGHHHSQAFMVESNSRTIPQDDLGLANGHVGPTQASAGEQPAVHSPRSVPFPHAAVAHPRALVHLTQISSSTESSADIRTPRPRRRVLLEAPVPQVHLEEPTASRLALLDRFTEREHPSGTRTTQAPDACIVESFGCADSRDSIEEDELYRSLADNELAVVPYGITLEQYLALVIFKCESTVHHVMTAELGFHLNEISHTCFPAAPLAQLCAQARTS